MSFESELMVRLHADTERRMRMFHGIAFLHGEEAAQKWLAENPPVPIELEREAAA